MADIHVLNLVGQQARLVYHFAVPAGNNSAGIPWKTALARSKTVVSAGVATPPSSVLPTGDGTGGTITSQELASIQSGDIAEVVFLEKARPATVAEMNKMYAKRKANWLAEASDTLRYYGATHIAS